MLSLLLLACGDNITVRGPGALLGEECSDQETCAEPLICAGDGTCQQEGSPGTTGLGGDCLDAEACQWGLACSAEAVCVDAADVAGAGEVCEADSDCALGLGCEDGVCEDLEVPAWSGVECEAVEGDFRVLFEVPDLPASSTLEFYRLPFPNDARLDGTVDLSGHPWPEALEGVREEAELQKGFPLSPTVFFRFSEPLDESTLDGGLGDSGTVWFASIDEDAEDYGLVEDFELAFDAGATRWACGDRLAVRSDPGQPLRPGSRYAVWLSKGLRSVEGEALDRDADFEVLMGDQRPGGDGDLRLVRAWEAYGDLRLFLARNGFDEDRVVGAAVFTAGDPGATARSAPYVVEQAGVEPSLALADCASSCAPCLGLAGASELGGELEVPLFDPRFAQSAGTEYACVHLVVPEGEPPAEGWPLALLGQDPGAELDRAASAFAEELAFAGVASVSLELPNHGQRGRADQAFAQLPEAEAWQQDRLQAAFELQQLLAALEQSGLELDLERLHVVGQGAGGEAALHFVAAHGEALTVTVGAVGGNTREGLVHGLGEDELKRLLHDPTVDAWHPAVAQLHASVEPADSAVHARELWKEPRGIFEGTHVLHLYVSEDPALSDQAQAAWQRAAFLPTGGEVLDDFGQSTASLPAQDNVLDSDGERHTAVSLQLVGDRDAVWEQASRVADFVGSAGEESPVVE